MMIVETDESIHQWHNEVGGHAWHITYASSSAELAQATGVKLPSLAPRSACRLYAVRPRAGGSRTRRPMVQPAVQELPELEQDPERLKNTSKAQPFSCHRIAADCLAHRRPDLRRPGEQARRSRGKGVQRRPLFKSSQ